MGGISAGTDVHFGKTHFKGLNIDAMIFSQKKNLDKYQPKLFYLLRVSIQYLKRPSKRRKKLPSRPGNHIRTLPSQLRYLTKTLPSRPRYLISFLLNCSFPDNAGVLKCSIMQCWEQGKKIVILYKIVMLSAVQYKLFPKSFHLYLVPPLSHAPGTP